MLKQADTKESVAFRDAMVDLAEVEQGCSNRAIPTGVDDANCQRPDALPCHRRLVRYMSGNSVRKNQLLRGDDLNHMPRLDDEGPLYLPSLVVEDAANC